MENSSILLLGDGICGSVVSLLVWSTRFSVPSGVSQCCCKQCDDGSQACRSGPVCLFAHLFVRLDFLAVDARKRHHERWLSGEYRRKGQFAADYSAFDCNDSRHSGGELDIVDSCASNKLSVYTDQISGSDQQLRGTILECIPVIFDSHETYGVSSRKRI